MAHTDITRETRSRIRCCREVGSGPGRVAASRGTSTGPHAEASATSSRRPTASAKRPNSPCNSSKRCRRTSWCGFGSRPSWHWPEIRRSTPNSAIAWRGNLRRRNDPVVAERVVKAALLRPGSIDLGKLHGEILAKSLDDGTAPDWLVPWGFCSRALLAYRSGDAESAVKYMKRSEEHKPEGSAHALNLVVRAMAQHQLRHPEEARRALDAASQVINRLHGRRQEPRQPGRLWTSRSCTARPKPS